MKASLRALLLAASASLALPALAQDAPPAAGKDYTIITLGNEEIKHSEVLDTWNGLFPGGSAPDFANFDDNIRQNVLRGLVAERLIYAEALKAGTDKDAEVKKRVEAETKRVIMASFMEKKSKDLVTDEQLKTAYAQKVAAAKGQEEVKARHILVPTEEEAKSLYEQIKKGGDFEKLAREKSADKGSGANGGELGWFTKERMVPEFAEAAFKLKKGDISQPLKSEFGWHIIKLEDRRPLKIASFDDMKDMLRSEAANNAVQSYVEGLMKKAEVKYYGADGKEKPFSTSLSPAAGGDAAQPAEKK